MLYIAYNRGLISINHSSKLYKDILNISKNDVICGIVADDRSKVAFNAFLDKSLTDKGLMFCLDYFKLGYQYVMKTLSSCNQVTIRNCTKRSAKTGSND